MAKRRRFTAQFKAEVVLEALRGESSQVSELCRRYNLSETQISTWKQQGIEILMSGFATQNKQSSESAKRIAELERLVGRLTLDAEIEKKSNDVVELSPSEKRHVVETLRKEHKEYWVRKICRALGFNKSTLYYQPKLDPSQDVLRAEIQQLAAQYPTYGYRRITKLLQRQGYTVGYKRVARLMKEENLSVSVKRVCHTTRSFEGQQAWTNHLETLEISRPDQVWVADITYVRLKKRFIYVAVLMDIFTRMIRGWQVSRHLNTSLTLKPLQEALLESGSPEIHHSDQGVQYLSTVYLSTLKEHGEP